jgi:hypothetical protein
VSVIVTNGTALPKIVTNRGAMPLVNAITSLLALIDMDDDRQSRPQRALSSSSTMRTGTRCTILVKLPVAFSGGMTLNWAPVAGARLATQP